MIHPRTAKDLNPVGTLHLRRSGVGGLVYRRTRLSNYGSLVGPGPLTLGKQWGWSRFYMPGEVLIAPGGTLDVRGDFEFMSGMRVGVYQGARLTVGDGGGMSLRGTLLCIESITIGDRVYIGDEVSIRDSDGHGYQVAGVEGRHTAPITIEDNVWIGHRATILKGVTIGRGAIVAAGSVVIRDVPPGTLVAGVPAKVVRENVSWSPEMPPVREASPVDR